jgi:hypothetical protein
VVRDTGIEPVQNYRPRQLQTADFSKMFCDLGALVVAWTLPDLPRIGFSSTATLSDCDRHHDDAEQDGGWAQSQFACDALRQRVTPL